MKKCLAILLALLLGAGGCACAEGAFAEVAGAYDFCSGAGAWDTELVIREDGSFTGNYHDNDMETGELNGVPYEAICYVVTFSGQLTPLVEASDLELDCIVHELRCDPAVPYVDDGVRYEPVEPYGIAKGDALRFFRAGTDVRYIPEALWSWLRMKEADPDWTALPYMAIYNATGDAGFSGSWETPAATAAPQPTNQWTLFTDAVPAQPAPARMTFPVDAEVVNCRQSVSLRSEPSTQAALLAEVPLGDLVQVYSNTAYPGSGRWFVDAAYNGLRGYICIEYLDILVPETVRARRQNPQGAAGVVYATSPGVDLLMRSGPGADYSVTGLLFGGEALDYLGDAQLDGSGTCWYHTSYYGADCWISARYTTLALRDGTRYTGGKGIY